MARQRQQGNLHSENVTRLKSAEAELFRGHTLITFDVSGGLLWIATNSNQGSVDGELGLPLATTQIYALSALMPEAM
jgi:hypothetical protein